MHIGIGCSRSSRFGNKCTCASNRRRAPCGLDYVLRWNHGFVDPSVLLRGLGVGLIYWGELDHWFIYQFGLVNLEENQSIWNLILN